MEIKIGKNARKCSACEADFVHDQDITSLVRIENREFQREDYCASCWKSERGAGSFSTWTLRFIDPKVAEQKPPEVFSPLRQLFYEAVESTERVELAKALLAAQLLRRQKVFRLIKESGAAEGESPVALYADRIGNRLIEVRDPNLTYSELEAGRGALLQRLEELENATETESEERTSDVQLAQN